MSPEKQAGLVLAVSTLVVVTFISVLDMLRAPSTTTAAVPVSDLPVTPASLKANVVPVKTGTQQEIARPAFDRKLLFPLKDFNRAGLRDNFDEGRGTRKHEAIDIMAPRGTQVVAVDEGRVAKLFRSAAGGITVYQFDRDEKYIYYYAHLDSYAQGLAEGMLLKRGDLVGYVGSTGNAPAHAPHLHFAIFELGPDKKWWKGAAINPYPHLKE